MAILKFSEELTPVVFREGINGVEVESQFGGTETRHFVNQYRDTKDTIFLPPQAQRQLETINPRQGETVLITKTKIKGKWEWSLFIAEGQQAQTRAQQAPAAARPAAQTQRIAPPPAGEPQPHALGYTPMPQGTGWAEAQHTPAPAAQPARQDPTKGGHGSQRPEARLMASALISAFEAAKITHTETGMSFDAGDIRALGISMYIEACKQRAESGRRAA